MISLASKHKLLVDAGAWYNAQLGLPDHGKLVPVRGANGILLWSIRHWDIPYGYTHEERAWAISLRSTRDFIVRASRQLADPVFLAQAAAYRLKSSDSNNIEIQARARSLNDALAILRGIPYPMTTGALSAYSANGSRFVANVDYVHMHRLSLAGKVASHGLRTISNAPDPDPVECARWLRQSIKKKRG